MHTQAERALSIERRQDEPVLGSARGHAESDDPSIVADPACSVERPAERWVDRVVEVVQGPFGPQECAPVAVGDHVRLPDDLAFVLSRYFPGQAFQPRSVTKHEHYSQRALIAQLFGYRLWSSEFQDHLVQQAEQIARRDVSPAFIVSELIDYAAPTARRR